MTKLRKPGDAPQLMERLAFADEVLEVLATEGADAEERIEAICARAEKNHLAKMNDADADPPLLRLEPPAPAPAKQAADEPPARDEEQASEEPKTKKGAGRKTS